MNKEQEFTELVKTVRDELIRECFDAWCTTETPEDRERIFYRAMAIEDVTDTFIARVKPPLEVA